MTTISLLNLDDNISKTFYRITHCSVFNLFATPTDITLKLYGQRFDTHRKLLTCSSQFFASLFEIRPESVKDTEFEIEGPVTPSVLGTILNYLYLGSINISLGNVNAILQGADFLQFRKVCHFCKDFLLQNCGITEANCFEILNCAVENDKPLFVYAASFYILHKYSMYELTTHEKFLKMSFPCLRKLIESPDLMEMLEMQVYQAVQNWLVVPEFCDDRKQHINEAMQLVRFEAMCKSDLDRIELSPIWKTIWTPQLASKVHVCKQLHHHWSFKNYIGHRLAAKQLNFLPPTISKLLYVKTKNELWVVFYNDIIIYDMVGKQLRILLLCGGTGAAYTDTDEVLVCGDNGLTLINMQGNLEILDRRPNYYDDVCNDGCNIICAGTDMNEAVFFDLFHRQERGYVHVKTYKTNLHTDCFVRVAVSQDAIFVSSINNASYPIPFTVCTLQDGELSTRYVLDYKGKVLPEVSVIAGDAQALLFYNCKNRAMYILDMLCRKERWHKISFSIRSVQKIDSFVSCVMDKYGSTYAVTRLKDNIGPDSGKCILHCFRVRIVNPPPDNLMYI